MTIITGTSGNDLLIGTNSDDILEANGGSDILKGKGGADTYALYFGPLTANPDPFYVINETRGGDATIDTITGVGSLTYYNYGNISYTEISRSGITGQNLVIQTAGKVSSYRDPGIETGKIKIVNQYNTDTPNAYVEKILIAAVEYNLIKTNTGTEFNDIITGWDNADTIYAGAGLDYLSGGAGRDTIHGEGGADIIFGGKSGDLIYGGTEGDTLFGGGGRDKIFGEDGVDTIYGGRGNDTLKGGAGFDTINGGDGNDRLYGGRDGDLLTGGAGDDIMVGGKGRDYYEISAHDGGSDVVIDFGQTWEQDTIVLSGITSIESLKHTSAFQKSGADLVMTYESITGVSGQLILQDQYLSEKNTIEHIRLETSVGNVLYHFAYLKGDDYTYSVHGGSDVGGEDIVLGSSGADEIYGGLGSDIMIGGAGVDTFFFHDEGDSRGGTDIILDFDLTQEKLDFTEIKTLTAVGLTIIDNAHGNVVISSIYGAIELDGLTTTEISNGIFEFF